MSNTSLLIQQTHLGTLVSKRLDVSLSAHGINFTEYTVMHHLNAAPNHKMSRISLADRIGLTASGVTRVLLPMEKNHLISRESNPRDARQSLVMITDVGKQLFKDSQVTAEYSAKEILSLLDQSEISLLVNLLNKLKC